MRGTRFVLQPFPEVVDCDDSGYPVILQDALVLDEHIAAAEEAVAVCPERALTLE